jgi:hypothetical protein
MRPETGCRSTRRGAVRADVVASESKHEVEPGRASTDQTRELDVPGSSPGLAITEVFAFGLVFVHVSA